MGAKLRAAMSDPARFVEQFEDSWARSSADSHGLLWRPDVELHQPILGSLYGWEACHEAFTRLFTLAPDLTLDVDGWSGDADSLYVSFAFRTEFGGSELRWPAVDRFRLDGEGKILRRDSFFDPQPVLGYLIRHPSGWPRALKARLIPRRPDRPPWPAPSPD